jgi:hypothetical protein
MAMGFVLQAQSSTAVHNKRVPVEQFKIHMEQEARKLLLLVLKMLETQLMKRSEAPQFAELIITRDIIATLRHSWVTVVSSTLRVQSTDPLRSTNSVHKKASDDFNCY